MDQQLQPFEMLMQTYLYVCFKCNVPNENQESITFLQTFKMTTAQS